MRRLERQLRLRSRFRSSCGSRMNRHASHIVQQEPSLLEAELKLEPDEWIDFPDLD
jgi:hypothetical protein